jgi:hypothetical protein
MGIAVINGGSVDIAPGLIVFETRLECRPLPGGVALDASPEDEVLAGPSILPIGDRSEIDHVAILPTEIAERFHPLPAKYVYEQPSRLSFGQGPIAAWESIDDPRNHDRRLVSEKEVGGYRPVMARRCPFRLLVRLNGSFA